jgi:hypothetical protein
MAKSIEVGGASGRTLHFALVLLLAFVSAARAQATLTGFVRADSTLQPLRDVEVLVESASRSTRTDGAGKFTLRDLPTGSVVVQARRVGYDPLAATIDLVAGTQQQVFYLKRSVAQLDTVAVASLRPRGMGRESFEERRRFGLGKFIDSTELRANEHRKFQDLLRQAGVRLVTPTPCRGRFRPPYCDSNQSKRVAVSASMAYECPMQVLLDGVTVYRPRGMSAGVAATPDFQSVEWETTFDLSGLMTSALEAVEVYRRAAEIPMEFGGSSAACGVLVIWTRRQ